MGIDTNLHLNYFLAFNYCVSKDTQSLYMLLKVLVVLPQSQVIIQIQRGVQQCYTKCLHKAIVLGELLNKRSEEIRILNHSQTNELVLLANQRMKYLVECEPWRERICFVLVCSQRLEECVEHDEVSINTSEVKECMNSKKHINQKTIFSKPSLFSDQK